MENGALILYARDADSGAYVERWRRKAHKKEVKDVAFGAGGGLLCSVAPDYQCLAFALGPSGALTGEPSAVAQPSFRFYRENKYNKGKGAQWRCIAVGEPAGGGASPLLFGALNHVGGPGWVARCALNGGSCEAYSQVASSPLTALALAANGSHVAVGTSDGELIVLDARTLAQLHKSQPHALFVTSLLLCPADAPSGTAAVTCAGDNSCILTPLPPAVLKPSGRGAAFWLSLLLALLAVLYLFVGRAASTTLPDAPSVGAALSEAPGVIEEPAQPP